MILVCLLCYGHNIWQYVPTYHVVSDEINLRRASGVGEFVATILQDRPRTNICYMVSDVEWLKMLHLLRIWQEMCYAQGIASRVSFNFRLCHGLKDVESILNCS